MVMALTARTYFTAHPRVHCADYLRTSGTAGGFTFGVAKRVNLIAVKVLAANKLVVSLHKQTS
jgi:hypothetical protein